MPVGEWILHVDHVLSGKMSPSNLESVMVITLQNNPLAVKPHEWQYARMNGPGDQEIGRAALRRILEMLGGPRADAVVVDDVPPEPEYVPDFE